MNNATIIFNESIQLMNDGKINGTGQFLTLENGQKQEIPEPIHTYKRWQALGFQVRKGEKAIAQFHIWKCSEKKAAEAEAKEEDQDTIKRMFMKKSSFFTLSQVELIPAGA